MKIFIDTANIEEIRECYNMGIIQGVTTNPSLVAKTGRCLEDVINDISSLIDGPISGEINPNLKSAEQMIEEGKQIASIHKNIVVKIPTTVEGLKACRVLCQQGIKTNLTLVFSVGQALLAAQAGATYISPFIGRLDDISEDGIQLIEDIVNVFKNYQISAQIIAASVRSPLHVMRCAKASVDIVTVPYQVINQLINHPLSQAGMEKFKNDYNSSI